MFHFETHFGGKAGAISWLRARASVLMLDASFWKLDAQRREAQAIGREVERLHSLSRRRFRSRARALNARLNRIGKEVVGF